MESPDDIASLLFEQHLELSAAQVLEDDLELAFSMQLQEAISASLSLVPSSSSSPPPNDAVSKVVVDTLPSLASLQSDELAKFAQEVDDGKKRAFLMRQLREDLDRRIHDQKVAREILRIPEDDWVEWGDEFEKPFDEGCLKNSGGEDIYRLYFKGIVSEEMKGVLVGIGVAICDPSDNLILEIRKPVVCNGMNKRVAELKALIEGLNAAYVLELKRITFYCDYTPLYHFVTGRWQPKQQNIATLVNQVHHLQKKFLYCNPKSVPRIFIKYAFQLARDAIVSQTTLPTETGHINHPKENCVICLEDTEVEHMFAVDACLHRYCFSCMKQHVEVKLLHGMVPRCPHEDCNSELKVESCKKFLTPKLIETMNQRVREALIPVGEKIYCPYPRCSALMSKHDVAEYAKDLFVGTETSGVRKCTKCHGLFCMNCKVPWHSNLTCYFYQRTNRPAEDLKLKSLANSNLWRQCVKCNHMIELSEGCYHMTCRCGFEFCYNCGEEWKDKKATCSCPLWDEDHILNDDRALEEEEEEEDEDDDVWIRFY